MANRIPNHGIYARLITEYVSHKRSLGYKMEETEERLRRFDQLTIDHNYIDRILPSLLLWQQFFSF